MKFFKKMIYAIAIISTLLLIFTLLYTQVNAANNSNTSATSVQGLVSSTSVVSQGIGNENILTKLISNVIAFIQVAVIGIAVFSLTLIGIKYFTVNAASAKAECKGELVRTFIGGVIAVSALQLARIVFEIFNP